MKAQEFNMSEKYGLASKSNGEEAAARDGKKPEDILLWKSGVLKE